MSAKTFKKEEQKRKKEESLVKTLHFMGWVYFGIIVIILISIFLEALSSELSFEDAFIGSVTNYNFALAIVCAVASGQSFSASAQIEEGNKEIKPIIFRNYMITSIAFGLIAMFVIAFWPPIPW